MLKVAMLAGPIAYTVSLAAALSHYCDIDIYCGKAYASNEDLGIFHHLPANVQILLYEEYRIRDLRSFISHYNLCKLLKNGNYDILHIQYAWDWPLIMLWWVILKKIPLVFTVHDPIQHKNENLLSTAYSDFMQKFFVKHANRIVVHGQTMRECFLKRYPKTNPEHVINCPHGDPSINGKDLREPIFNPAAPKVILFFGNIRSYKGLSYLIQAEPIIARRIKEFTIHIVGRGLDSSYKQHIVNREHFLIREEFVPHNVVADIFKQASVVVLPYVGATQSGVIPIAYAFGKPVIATKVGGLVDVVEDGKTGMLVEPCDANALAEAIITLLSDDDLRKHMGENAFDFVRTTLSWNNAASTTYNLYKALV